jgi:cytochrome P460
VLVKEVFQAATKPMKTGTVSRAETLKGWFVMIRGSKNSHPNNSLWGDGGWSWFDAGNPSKTTSTNCNTDSVTCHVPAQATDLVYVEGYPPLAAR